MKLWKRKPRRPTVAEELWFSNKVHGSERRVLKESLFIIMNTVSYNLSSIENVEPGSHAFFYSDFHPNKNAMQLFLRDIGFVEETGIKNTYVWTECAYAFAKKWFAEQV